MSGVWGRPFVAGALALSGALFTFHVGAQADGATASSSPARVRVSAKFDGSTATRSMRSGPLPDTSVAVGPWNLLSSASDLIRYTTRRGAQPQEERSATLFDDAPGTGPSTALFDRLSSRAFLASVSTSAGETVVHLAANLTNHLQRLPESGNLTTTRGWCTYTFPLGRLIVDPQVRLGASDRWLVATVRPEGAEKAVLLVLDKTRLLDYEDLFNCAQMPPTLFVLDAKHRGIAPAVHSTRSQERRPPLYLLSSEADASAADKYTLWTLSGGNKPRLRRQTLAAPDSYDAPPTVPQRGGPAWGIGDGGLAAAAFRDGHLWGVHSVACPGTPDRACLRVLDIEPEGDARRAASIVGHTIAGARRSSLAMPGIAINKSRDVAVTFVRSRSNTFPSVGAAILGHGDNAFGAQKILAAGKCAVGAGLAGAPSATVQTDPSDDSSFWVSAPRPVQEGRCGWATQLTHFSRRQPVPPPTEILAAGTFALPSTTQFSGPGFRQEFEAIAQVPAALGSTRGARLVLRLRDAGRPNVDCALEHPLSGCASVDYAEPGSPLVNSITVSTTAGLLTLNLTDSLLLTRELFSSPG